MGAGSFRISPIFFAAYLDNIHIYQQRVYKIGGVTKILIHLSRIDEKKKGGRY